MNSDKTEFIAHLNEMVAEIQERIERNKRVITGTPWIIECSPGFFLVADGDGYRGGSITGRVVQYTPQRIDAAVAYIRDNSQGVFDGARKVAYKEALQAELKSYADLIEKFEEQMA